MRRELLIGAGSDHRKKLCLGGNPQWESLTTLDSNADHRPDIVWDLKQLPLPFDDNSFDEIHAYEVLEHLRMQGDWQGFFDDFSEYWRILKPAGALIATVPMWNSMWAWGDPSHRRIINHGSLVFLVQPEYEKQVGKTPMSDFRFCYCADFDVVHMRESGETFEFALEAVKPSRCKR